MENQNANQELEELKRKFSNYQKEKADASPKKKTKEEILAKYFVPRKPQEIIRFLPLKSRNSKPLEEAYFHSVSVNIAGGLIKHGQPIYCPAHNDPKVQKLDSNGKPLFDQESKPVMVPAPCPLCDKAKRVLAKQDGSLKGIKKENMNPSQLAIWEKNKQIFKEAKGWEAKLYYIGKVIDRLAERDGPKFWRFVSSYLNKGTFDKLTPIMNLYLSKRSADYADVVNGADFIITMDDTPNPFNPSKTYKTVSAITYDDKSPLHHDATVQQQWLGDETTWRNVFLPKQAPNTSPFEFLEMVANGTNPYWDDTDTTKKRWIFPGRPDLEERANTRTQDLTGGNEKEFKQASDLVDTVYVQQPTIANITPESVGTFKDTAMDLGATALKETEHVVDTDDTDQYEDDDNSSDDEYGDDLPF